MERLILIIGYMGFEGGGDEVHALFYESKEKFLSDIETEYQLIKMELDANPVPNIVLSEYDVRDEGKKNLKPKAEFDAIMSARRVAIEKYHEIEAKWTYDNVITFKAYQSTKAPKEGDWHSIEVYTVEEFFNDPDRIISL